MAGSERVYKRVLKQGLAVAAYSNIYGGFMTGAAFECVASALMLKGQTKYASSNCDQPKEWPMSGTTVAQELKAIQCLAHNCVGDLGLIKLMK